MAAAHLSLRGIVKSYDGKANAVDGIVLNAQSLVRHGLSPREESRSRGTKKARTPATRR